MLHHTILLDRSTHDNPFLCVPTDSQRRFDATIRRASSVDTSTALKAVFDAEERLAHAKEWFWSFDDAKSKKVALLQQNLDEAESVLVTVVDERTAIENEAKAEVGLFSEVRN